MKTKGMMLILAFTFYPMFTIASANKNGVSKHMAFNNISVINHNGKVDLNNCQKIFSDFDYEFKGENHPHTLRVNNHHKVVEFSKIYRGIVDGKTLVVWKGRSTSNIMDHSTFFLSGIKENKIIKGVVYNDYCKATVIISRKL